MSEEARATATAKDALFFQTILCSMKNKPDVDWAIVAAKAGYKDGRTASTRYGQIMKKLTGVSAGQAMAGNTSGSPTKASPKKIGIDGAGAGAGRGVKKEKAPGNGVIGAKVVKSRKNGAAANGGTALKKGIDDFDDDKNPDVFRQWDMNAGKGYNGVEGDLKKEEFTVEEGVEF